MLALLKEKYPDHKWDTINFLKGKGSQQKKLERVVSFLVPKVNK